MTDRSKRIASLLPGLALCVAVSLAAMGLQAAEESIFARSYLQAIVLAILLGMVARAVWTPPASLGPGIGFSAKTLLEIAVMLLGATISAQLLLSVGPALLVGIVGIVGVALAAGYGIARALGLPHKMALLIASGNSICGNSAIAAVAPVIGASAADVVSSITFTAILGVVVVLALPLLVPLAGLTEVKYGVLAGLTVYAVPQVLAATLPVGATSAQIGTFVKLVRVLLLGPLVIGLSMMARRSARAAADAPGEAGPARLPLSKALPWFIIGFLLLMGLRSANLIPQGALQPVAFASEFLTIVAMAALGLGVDVRVVARAGGRITLAVTLSLLVLAGLSLALVLSGAIAGP